MKKHPTKKAPLSVNKERLSSTCDRAYFIGQSSEESEKARHRVEVWDEATSVTPGWTEPPTR